MKNSPRHFHPLLHHGLAIIALVSTGTWAYSELNATFTVPPYTLNESIVETDGWEMLYREPHPIYTDPLEATLIDSPVVSAQQPTTLSLKTMLKNARMQDLGDRFVVETQFAVAFNQRYHFEGGLFFRFASTNEASPFHFGFDYGDDGGLYFQGGGGKVVVLPKQEIQENVAYLFSIRVDMGAQSFGVTVTSSQDETFRHESKEVPFHEGFTAGASGKMAGFFMGNNKPSLVDSYVDYVRLTPLME